METYRTMGQAPTEADLLTIGARVEGQGQLLSFVREPLVGVVTNAVKEQEETLRTVYRPIIEDVSRQVRRQGEQLSTVSEPIVTNLRTQVASNGSALAGVVGALPPEERDALRQPPEPIPYTPSDLIPTETPVIEQPPNWTDAGNRTGGILLPLPTPTDGAGEPPARLPQPQPTNGDGSYVFPPQPTVPPTTAVGPRPSPPTVRPGTATPSVTVTHLTSGAIGSTCPQPTVNLAVNCPAPPPPPPPPPRPTPVTPAVSGLREPTVPNVGVWDTTHPRLCANLDEYVNAFARVGGEVRQIIFAMLNMGADVTAGFARLAEIPTIGSVFGFISAPAAVLTKVFQQVGNMIMGYGALFTGGRGDALVGLYFTRGWIKTLSDASLGVNFIVTAQVHVDVVPSQTLKIVEYLINYLHPVEVPAIGEIEHLYLTGEIPYAEAVCLAKMQDRQEKEFARGARSRRTRLSPDLEVKHWLQWRTDGNTLADRLRGYGMTESQEVQRLIDLNFLLPPPSDAIRFSNRDVFDPNKLGLAEMRKEYNQQVGLQDLFSAIGLEKKTIKTQQGKNVELDLPFWYYIAAYEEASPTQTYEMFHRLRPNRINRYGLRGNDGKVSFPEPVGLETVRSLLKEKDYNPIWRDRLAAIAYRVPGRIDIRNMYRRGVFGVPRGNKGMNRANLANPLPIGPAETELRERYLDLGYNEQDANVETLLDTTEFDRLDGAAARKRTMGRVCKAYKVGGFTYDQSLAQLTNAGVERSEAIEFLGGCDLDMRIADLVTAVNGVRKQFLAGVVNDLTARTLLRGYGVANTRIDTHLSHWNLQRTVRQRELTAEQVLKYWEEGIINLADARARLINLGYDGTAANMMLNHVRVGQAAKGRKEAERVQRLRETEQRRALSAAQKEQKEREAAQQRRMNRFLSLQTEKNLAAWWKAGEITEPEVRAALETKGANPVDIERWLNTNRPKS